LTPVAEITQNPTKPLASRLKEAVKLSNGQATRKDDLVAELILDLSQRVEALEKRPFDPVTMPDGAFEN
jgi:hypothetical protein